MSALRVQRGAASVTTSASGSAPDAARSLRFTAAARKPSSRQPIQSSRKWTFSTSASCVTTTPPASSAASCSTPTISPRRSSSSRRPTSPSSESLIDRLPQPRVGRRTDHRDPGRTGTDAVARIRRVDAADRHDRDRDRTDDLHEALEPDRRLGVRLRRRLPHRPDAEVVRVRRTRLLQTRRRAAEEQALGPRELRALVPLPEVNAVRAEPQGSLDVVVDDERDAEPGKADPPFHDLVGTRLHPQLHNRRARLDRQPRGREIRDDRLDPHETRALSSSVSGSSAASASYRLTWKLPGPFASRAASSPATPN